MKRILACTLAVVMLLALMAGCGSAKADLGGKYVATSCFSSSDGTEYEPGGDYLYLSSDGGGYFHFMDEDLDIEWTLKGDTFTFTDSTDDTFTGTYADGVIDGSIGGLDYVFELGAEVPASNAKEAAADVTEDAAPEEEPADEDDTPADVAAPAGDFTPVEGDLGDYYVAILGAEAIEDYDGEPAIRIYYSFTNNSDEPESASWALELSAEEAGYDLDTDYVSSSDDVEEYGNYSRDIYPGVTILCEQIYTCNPDDDIITFSVTDWWDETDTLTCDFSYSNLPGRPDPIEFESITEPVVTTDLATEGDISDEAYVALTGAELTEDYNGNPTVRVFMDYTNNGDEDASCWWNCTIYVYQNGVELLTTIPDDSLDSDTMFDEDIAPGETASCSECFELFNTTDPVEIIISDYGDNPIGMAYTFG